MKANEAPEKLYIALNELTEDGRTFVLDHRTDYPICTEYLRADAFVEKAEKWIDNFLSESTLIDYKVTPIVRNAVIENFKNYMKGG